ncbi:DNA-directed RNA polymerase III subunit rpc5 [Psilocybe cubensis]|uniref:DNA-directed RNA polymerase III subunit Rpc5 n=2 Tax=Psilocybe cubensis TaxID=181762 RepID=A0A8H7Y7L9_PSICU|nr:DNA-directed RNA polymerase III subunit rpc5 [Psilocybe cubensis]KAH9486791.1 DNA-directed RNA polymerase III subunit rpc5 [Psilocybe cubensis]
MDVDENDELVSVLPIHYSEALSPNLHIHQFPLLTRPLQAPPSATLSGKRINARIKHKSRRIEIHVPIDTRPEVYNVEKSKHFGAGRLEDDREKNQERIDKTREDEDPRISEVRLRSEEIPRRGAHILGIVRDGKLHLHPVQEMHQFRPTLTYLDILSRKNRRSMGVGSDSDSDDGPPPDPDEVAPVPVAKKEKKAANDAKEVHVSARKSEDQGGQSGLSSVRREMLQIMRAEEDEKWEDVQFCDVTTDQSVVAFESVFSQSDEILETSTDISTFLKSINGL